MQSASCTLTSRSVVKVVMLMCVRIFTQHLMCEGQDPLMWIPDHLIVEWRVPCSTLGCSTWLRTRL